MAEDGRRSGHEGRHHRRKRPSAEEREPERRKKKKMHQEVKKIKHVETFYEKPPPGMIKEDDDKPEDCIPDLPGNEEARDFLAHAPTKGLWMPLGKEVKVMQCWRCKNFGHRTGDRECPYFISGNQKLEQFRVAHEDPMYDVIRENKRHEKETRSSIASVLAGCITEWYGCCREMDQRLIHRTLKVAEKNTGVSFSPSPPPPPLMSSSWIIV
ncbi:retinitis pigmentosa 9 protein isoform X1 [Narcine bancroftii]|uniref:retinitis pigmentosa 9 protein isoform X1 n=1 Tax=Narcine bancroftii TaxID=1343680 RepID=UPI0038310887